MLHVGGVRGAGLSVVDIAVPTGGPARASVRCVDLGRVSGELPLRGR
ncbi:hypothetical protein SAMN06272735_6194 [Streptomyces sp. TLI_55]|nr:hypothetical protein SAMN06272735_6194 [Streptomyces sp. TLI_55]